jgi:hypothetical protein
MSAPDLLTFDEAAHEYRLGGVRVPGVTSVLRPLADFSGIPRDVLAAKADLGRRVHAACEFDDDGDLDEDSIEDDVRPYLEGWRAFLRDSGAKVLHNERRVLDTGLMYAGTLDNVLLIDGAQWLVDKKTCITLPPAVGPQTAAYMRALADPAVTHRGALRLRPDGTYRLDQLTCRDDWSVFLACLTLTRWRESNA